jgi:hypothetical protein
MPSACRNPVRIAGEVGWILTTYRQLRRLFVGTAIAFTPAHHISSESRIRGNAFVHQTLS